MVNTTYIYTGIWTNWNGNSPISGLTLTCSPKQGPLLIAFLALFVSLIGSNLWSIACFVTHQTRSSSTSRQGWYHQQQSLLSNCPGTGISVWTFIRLAWRWRAQKQAIWSSSYLAILSTSFLILLTASGIFSSKVVTTGDEVLVRSDICGWTPGLTDPDVAMSDGDNVVRWMSASQRIAKAQQYVEGCYEKTGVIDSGLCDQYTLPFIEFKVNRSIECPFGSDFCAGPNSIQIDTGYIDSSNHLGINTPEADRISFRKLLTCAPTTAEEKYSSDWTDGAPQDYPWYDLPFNKIKYYYLGPSDGIDSTFWLGNYTVWDKPGGYSLDCSTTWDGYYSDWNVSDFIPIPDVQVPSSDINLLFLFGTPSYADQVVDPWFSATNMTDTTGAYFQGLYEDSYTADHVVSVLGCTEQYQFCTSKACSSPAGLLAKYQTPNLGLELSPTQEAIFAVIWEAATASKISELIYTLADQLLLANRYLYSARSLQSAGLPEDQWEQEVQHLAAVSLATLQGRVVEYASPPESQVSTPEGMQSSHEFVARPDTPALSSLCQSIRVRNPKYLNFSVLGLTIVLSLGTVIIIMNWFCLPGLVFWARRKRGKRMNKFNFADLKSKEWCEGQIFRLQGRSFSGNTFVEWDFGSEKQDIPLTLNQNLRFPASYLWETEMICTPELQKESGFRYG